MSPAMAGDVTLDRIRDARARIGGRVHRTPLTGSGAVSRRLGVETFLKLELFQKTGSFKARGAWNKVLNGVLNQPAADRGKGLVAVSGGNHAQAVAYVGQQAGIPTTIIVPANTPPNYLAATRGYGANVVLAPNIAEGFALMPAYEARGWTAVHPFDDPDVINGSGVVGLEILEDCPDVTDIVLSIGGGGLMSGVAAAVKTLRPEVKLWGVETEGADAMARALVLGQPYQMPAITSIAKTLGAPIVSERTLLAAQRYLECVTVVPDSAAVQSMRFLLERIKVLPEPAAACTLAAADVLRDRFQTGGKVVLILCGGNVGLRSVAQLLA